MIRQRLVSPRHCEKTQQKVVKICLILLFINVLYLINHNLPSNPVHRTVRRCPGFQINWSVLGTFRYNSRDIIEEYDNLVLQKSDGELSDDVIKNGSLRQRKGKGSDDSAYMKLPACSEVPWNLEGDMPCRCDPVSPEDIQTRYPSMETGGRLRPKDCRPTERLAVIIPYKNRHSHLHVLLNVLIPLLTKQHADATFFVVEQAAPSMFNRATLHNIGFLEAQKLGDFDCYIFHDVDLVPIDDRIMYHCAENPRHFAVSIKRYGYRRAKKMYNEYFGGIVGLTRTQYLSVNGNSNIYFGWGGEDDDLLIRILNRGYQRVRDDPDIYKYQMLRHERNDKSRGNVDRMLMLRTAEDRQVSEGLGTTVYTVNSIQQYQLYTWINVTLNMTQLLMTAPDYVRDSIRSIIELSKTVS